MASFKPSTYPDGFRPTGDEKMWKFWDAFVNPITMLPPTEIEEKPIISEFTTNYAQRNLQIYGD